MAEDGVVLRQHGAIFADKWSAGERRVRQVMLGHPDASILAGLPPAWVRYVPDRSSALTCILLVLNTSFGRVCCCWHCLLIDALANKAGHAGPP